MLHSNEDEKEEIIEAVKMWEAIGYVVGAVIMALSSSNTSSRNRQAMQDMNTTNIEFSKNEIQNRVRGAKEAGIHPLFALGAPSSTPVINAVTTQDDTGSHIGEAVRSLGKLGDLPQTKLQDKMILDQQKQDIQESKSREDMNKAVRLKAIAETQKLNLPRSLYVQAIDNNPNSATYKKKIWVIDPEIAESMDSMAANIATLYANTQGGPDFKKSHKVTQGHILKGGSATRKSRVGRKKPKGKITKSIDKSMIKRKPRKRNKSIMQQR